MSRRSIRGIRKTRGDEHEDGGYVDPKLSEQLQQTLAALLANAQDAAAWTKGQVPLLVQEKILFGRIWSTAMVIMLAALGVWLYGSSKQFYAVAKAHKDAGRHDVDMWLERPGGMLNIGAAILCAVVSCLALEAGRNAALAWFAPRLYIVEWLMEQMHK